MKYSFFFAMFCICFSVESNFARKPAIVSEEEVFGSLAWWMNSYKLRLPFMRTETEQIFTRNQRLSRRLKNPHQTLGVWELPNKSRSQKLVARALAPDVNNCADEKADKDSTECKRRKCYYCCSDRLCYPEKQYAYDCFDRKNYCDNLCDDEWSCRLYGCSYDVDQKKCFGKKGMGMVGYNFCGERVKGSDGVVYLPKKLNPPVLCLTIGFEYTVPRCLGPDKELYTNEIFALGNDKLNVPFQVPADAEYEIGLKFCDPVRVFRNMTYYINGIYLGQIVHDTTTTTPHLSTTKFTVTGNVTLLTVKTKTASISNSINVVLTSSGRNLDPILSALYIKKLT